MIVDTPLTQTNHAVVETKTTNALIQRRTHMTYIILTLLALIALGILGEMVSGEIQ